MIGISPEQAADFMSAHGCHIAALNCHRGAHIHRFREILDGRTAEVRA